MKLYYAPGACSLASRISFREAGRAVDFERVDVHSKITERGEDYLAINPKGYVPMLVLDNGMAVTENVAVLALIAHQSRELRVKGPLAWARLLEMLSYLSSEVHVAFKPLWHSDDDLEKAEARKTVAKRLRLLEEQLHEMYLFGPRFTVADAYLFVMLRWALDFGVPISAELSAYFERVAERPGVRRALAEEGLALPLPRSEDVVTIAEVAVA
jgi:glutathione S-transferase